MKYTWKEIFNQAKRFHKSSYLLNQNEDPDLKIVSWSNGAFALELYFKALNLKLNPKAKIFNHKINEIFKKFSIEIQNNLKDVYKNEINQRPHLAEEIKQIKQILPDFSIDYEYQLEYIEKSFISFRYIYEKNKAVLMFYNEIRNSVITEIKRAI